MGYYQGCESAYTHTASCCTAGSPDHDEQFVCSGRFAGYDWFKTGPAPHAGVSKPDATVNHTNSATLIRDAAVEFIGRQKSADQPFYLYLPFQNIHEPYTCDHSFRQQYVDAGGFSAGECTIFGYITEMDKAVGDVVAAVDKIGQTANTVYIFSSDNGAPPASADVNHERPGNPVGWIARNYPFRGR